MSDSVLPECVDGFHDLRLEVGVVKSELKTQEKVIDKLTEGIEKIQEVNTNLLRMLAIHEEKHEIHEKIEENIDDDIRDLHSRITTESRTTQEKIDVLKTELYGKIDLLRKDITESILKKEEPIPTKNLSDKLKELDRWKYLLITLILIIIWIIEHINLKMLSQLFSGN